MAATLLPVPKYAITELNSMAFSFIWGRRDKIHREMVIKPISEGGLGMVDIEKLFDSFKAFWLKRLLSSDNIVDSWAQLPQMYLNELKPNEIILNLRQKWYFQETWQYIIFLEGCGYKCSSLKSTYVQKKAFNSLSFLSKYAEINIFQKKEMAQNKLSFLELGSAEALFMYVIGMVY